MRYNDEKVKDKLLKLSTDRVPRESIDFLKEVRKEFPGIDEDVLRTIEGSPSYIKNLTNRHITYMLRRESEIWDKLLDKSAAGDVKAMGLYFKLTRRLNDVAELPPVKRNYGDMTDADLDKALKETANAAS
jgi:hypothetical protein